MNRIPITGYLFHSGDSSATHSHELYLTSWNGVTVTHRHMFAGTTSVDDMHDHKYIGVTEPAPTGVPHVHQYRTLTSVTDGHQHIIEGVTGPAISVPTGGHVHYFEGFTTINGRRPHSHHYNGTTRNMIE